MVITILNIFVWEQRKLSDKVTNIGTGKSTFIKHTKSTKYPYAVLGSTSIIGFDNAYDYSGQFILIDRVGAHAGETYTFSGNVKISDNTIFICCQTVYFIKALLDILPIKKLSFGSGQPLIKSSELKKLQLRFPSLAEMNNLNFLISTLNKLLDLQQRKVDLLKQLKKGLLQKMFADKDSK